MKIRYKTRHGIAEWVEFTPIDSEILKFIFDSCHNGALMLGSKIYDVIEGEAHISLSSLPDGNYIPKVETNLGIFVAEGFTKSGHTVTMHEADEEVVRSLISRCFTLEEKLESLEQRTYVLEKMCQGHHIFNFERK